MSGSFRRGRLLRALIRVGLHRHRPDPDLSAVLAFPSCRCGELLWPQSGPATGPASPDPLAPADGRARRPRPGDDDLR